jgi:hypothetical protein
VQRAPLARQPNVPRSGQDPGEREPQAREPRERREARQRRRGPAVAAKPEAELPQAAQRGELAADGPQAVDGVARKSVGVASAVARLAEAQPRQRGAKRQRAQHAAVEPEARGLKRAQAARRRPPERGRQHALDGAVFVFFSRVVPGAGLDGQLRQHHAKPLHKRRLRAAELPARLLLGACLRIAAPPVFALAAERQAQAARRCGGGVLAERAAGREQAQQHGRVLAHGRVLEQSSGPLRWSGRGPPPAAAGLRSWRVAARSAPAACLPGPCGPSSPTVSMPVIFEELCVLLQQPGGRRSP